MPERPYISVITVSYNSAETIGETLESLMAQTSDDFESIVVDGHSTDGTVEVVNRYDQTVDTFISEPDRGIYDAMNKGIVLARGKYLAFLNSDDAYFPDTVALVKEFAESTHAAIVYGNIRKERSLKGETLFRVERPDLRRMTETMGIFHPATFVKKELFDQFGLYDLRFRQASDYHWLLRAYLAGVQFGYLDAPLARFRIGGVSSFSCESYREAADIQRELQTGSPDDMQNLYEKCLAKQKRNRWMSKLMKWPILGDIYRNRVKKRWS